MDGTYLVMRISLYEVILIDIFPCGRHQSKMTTICTDEPFHSILSCCYLSFHIKNVQVSEDSGAEVFIA